MSKARDLADLIAAGNPLADGTVEVADISDLTATATELNYVDGVTSAVQTQIDTKAPTANPTFTGTVTSPTVNASTELQIGGTAITATAAELNYVDGVTSNVQTQLDAKQAASTAVTTSTTFGGDVSGTYDALVIADDSHNHTISNVDNLQTTLDAKQEEFTPNEVTTSTTASADNRYFLNGATITLTLPASPTVGDTVAITEIGGNADNIIGRNGSNIMSLAEDMTVDAAYASFQLQYVDATIGWAIAH